jgi:hypothetical protein
MFKVQREVAGLNQVLRTFFYLKVGLHLHKLHGWQNHYSTYDMNATMCIPCPVPIVMDNGIFSGFCHIGLINFGHRQQQINTRKCVGLLPTLLPCWVS